jgi:hypothetical protein
MNDHKPLVCYSCHRNDFESAIDPENHMNVAHCRANATRCGHADCGELRFENSAARLEHVHAVHPKEAYIKSSIEGPHSAQKKTSKHGSEYSGTPVPRMSSLTLLTGSDADEDRPLQCQMCGREDFSVKEERDNHIEVAHYSDGSHRCWHDLCCGLYYADLGAHVVSVHAEDAWTPETSSTEAMFVCKHCGENSFVSYQEKLDHEAFAHMKEGSTSCPHSECVGVGRGLFSSNGELKDHVYRAHCQPSWRCTSHKFCFIKFSTKARRDKHMEDIHLLVGPKTWCRAEDCGILFESTSELNKHAQHAHGTQACGKYTVYCRARGCDTGYMQIGDLKQHISESHPSKLGNADGLPSIRQSRSLTRAASTPLTQTDQEQGRSRASVEAKGAKGIICPFCGQIGFANRRQIADHELFKHAKHGNLNKACPASACMYVAGFSSPEALYDHIWNVHKIPHFVCAEQNCRARYTTGDKLKEHSLKAHNGVHNLKAYCRAVDCCAVFDQRAQLLEHVDQEHEGSKQGLHPFWCAFPDCNEGFRRRHELEAHVKKHLADEDSIADPAPTTAEATTSEILPQPTETSQLQRANERFPPLQPEWSYSTQQPLQQPAEDSNGRANASPSFMLSGGPPPTKSTQQGPSSRSSAATYAANKQLLPTPPYPKSERSRSSSRQRREQGQP